MINVFGELKQDSLVVAAVSGGADSVYLLHLLKAHAEEEGFHLAVAHVNHRTRGVESDGDEEFVRQLAERLHLPFHVRRLEAERAPGMPDQRNEVELRRLRLMALKTIARGAGAVAIVFGHHRDDLAETFLLNALRGSGPGGLEGMRPVRRLDDGMILMRPLLDVRRVDIEQWLRKNGEDWRDDMSNLDPRFRRNRIRNEVIPLLESIEPGAVANLAVSAAFSGEAYEFLLEQTSDAADQCLLASAHGVVLFAADKVRLYARRDFAPGMIRNVFRRVIGGHEAEVPILPNRDVIRRITRRLTEESGEESFFHLGHDVSLLLTNRYGLMHLGEDSLDAALHVAGGFTFALTPPGTSSSWGTDEFTAAEGIPMYLPGWAADYEVSVEERTYTASAYLAESPMHRIAYIDLDEVKGKLTTRILDPGERIPLAGGGSKTVRACLQEAGVPPRLRHFISGFADEGGVLWIPGVRRAARAWISDKSNRILVLRQVSKAMAAQVGNIPA